jgi:hypothetical protein
MSGDATPIPWWQAEPQRLARDRQEIEAAFPNLSLTLEGEGHWAGDLPMWTFDRPQPPGLVELLGGRGLQVLLVYGSAYPLVTPYIIPTSPRPEPEELTQTRWHVLGNGALCTVQTQADWDPNSSIVTLLHKAVGWHVEYALMRAGVRDEMTMPGIVNDDSLDDLIAVAVQRRQDATASTDPGLDGSG